MMIRLGVECASVVRNALHRTIVVSWLLRLLRLHAIIGLCSLHLLCRLGCIGGVLLLRDVHHRLRVAHLRIRVDLIQWNHAHTTAIIVFGHFRCLFTAGTKAQVLEFVLCKSRLSSSKQDGQNVRFV